MEEARDRLSPESTRRNHPCQILKLVLHKTCWISGFQNYKEINFCFKTQGLWKFMAAAVENWWRYVCMCNTFGNFKPKTCPCRWVLILRHRQTTEKMNTAKVFQIALVPLNRHPKLPSPVIHTAFTFCYIPGGIFQLLLYHFINSIHYSHSKFFWNM